MSAFWSMGGYGAFVWPAYGLTVMAIGGLIVMSLRARARLRRQIRHLDPSFAPAEDA